jgi:hypothetical protein
MIFPNKTAGNPTGLADGDNETSIEFNEAQVAMSLSTQSAVSGSTNEGRPSLSEDGAIRPWLKRRILTFRLTDEEFDKLQKASVAGGSRSVSDFARSVLLNSGNWHTGSTSQEHLRDRLAELEDRLALLADRVDSLTTGLPAHNGRSTSEFLARTAGQGD